MSKVNENPHNGDEGLYYRIATYYYKRCNVPMADGSYSSKLIKWNADNIKLDHGRDALNDSDIVKKISGFCVRPSHFKYQRIIDDEYYNRYEPLPVQPSIVGNCDDILQLYHHIFGEQYQLGLDYTQILLIYPCQILPVLCLASTERRTGKSTFLFFLKSLFGDNMILLGNNDFTDKFTSSYACKLIIATEETFLDKKEQSETIKRLSTTKYTTYEAKGIDKEEVQFFGKFILCTNNEYSFISLDDEEVRYWVRKVPKLNNADPKFLDKLIAEIPSFLYFLQHRKLTTENTSRMWFTSEQIETDALRNLKKANRDKTEFELAQIFISIIDNLQAGQEEVSFCLGDALKYVKSSGIRNADSNSLKRLLQNTWGIMPESNSKAYTKWLISPEGIINHISAKGRYYSIGKNKLIELGFLDASDAV